MCYNQVMKLKGAIVALGVVVLAAIVFGWGGHALAQAGTTTAATNPIELKTLQSLLFSDQLYKIWTTLLILTNVAVIIFFFAIAFSTILHINVDTFGIRKAILPLVLGVIMANFSLQLSRLIIDASNVLALNFYNQLGGSGGAAAAIENAVVSGGAAKIQEAVNAVGGLGTMLKVLVYGGPAVAAIPLIAAIINVGAVGSISIMLAFVATVLLAIYLFAPAILMLFLAFLLYARVYFLLFLVAVSPLAFLAISWAPLQWIFRKWWSFFLNWSFMGPAVVFMLWLVELFNNSGNGTATFPTYVLAVIMLYLCVQVPFMMGGQVMAVWGGLGKKALGWGVNTLGWKLPNAALESKYKTSPRAMLAGIKQHFDERTERNLALSTGREKVYAGATLSPRFPNVRGAWNAARGRKGAGEVFKQLGGGPSPAEFQKEANERERRKGSALVKIGNESNLNTTDDNLSNLFDAMTSDDEKLGFVELVLPKIRDKEAANDIWKKLVESKPKDKNFLKKVGRLQDIAHDQAGRGDSPTMPVMGMKRFRFDKNGNYLRETSPDERAEDNAELVEKRGGESAYRNLDPYSKENHREWSAKQSGRSAEDVGGGDDIKRVIEVLGEDKENLDSPIQNVRITKDSLARLSTLTTNALKDKFEKIDIEALPIENDEKDILRTEKKEALSDNFDFTGLERLLNTIRTTKSSGVQGAQLSALERLLNLHQTNQEARNLTDPAKVGPMYQNLLGRISAGIGATTQPPPTTPPTPPT